MGQIQFRVTDAEHEAIKENAAREGKTITAYIKDRLETVSMSPEHTMARIAAEARAEQVKAEPPPKTPYERRVRELQKTLPASAARMIAFQEGLRPE